MMQSDGTSCSRLPDEPEDHHVEELKCSRCRKELGPLKWRPCQPDLICIQVPDVDHDDDDDDVNQVALLPDWLQQQIQQCGWTKAKVMCPGCECHIGSMDFVGGHATDEAIRLARSKVDVAMKPEVRQQVELLLNSRQPKQLQPAPPATDPESDSDLYEDDGTCSGWEGVECGLMWCSNCSLPVDTPPASPTPSAASGWIESQSEVPASETSFVLPPSQPDLVKAIMQAEPELDALDSSLICPVCLDLLFEPHQVWPCKHNFCSPCLRRLATKNPLSTSCPMCRQAIDYCHPLHDLAQDIRTSHADLYRQRQSWERSTQVLHWPLPWRLGWKTLLSGRLLGGNRFDQDAVCAVLRQLGHQLPYHVPSVVLANLINLLLFLCLMSAMELAPLLFWVLMGKPMPSPWSSSSTTASSRSQASSSSSSSSSSSPSRSTSAVDHLDVETSTAVEDMPEASGSYIQHAAQVPDAASSGWMSWTAKDLVSLFFAPDFMGTTFYFFVWTMVFLLINVLHYFLYRRPNSMNNGGPASAVATSWRRFMDQARSSTWLYQSCVLLLMALVPILVMVMWLKVLLDMSSSWPNHPAVEHRASALGEQQSGCSSAPPPASHPTSGHSLSLDASRGMVLQQFISFLALTLALGLFFVLRTPPDEVEPFLQDFVAEDSLGGVDGGSGVALFWPWSGSWRSAALLCLSLLVLLTFLALHSVWFPSDALLAAASLAF